MKLRDIPLGTYPLGTYAISARPTPNGLNGMDIRIGRCTTATPDLWADPNTFITIDLQFSFDGGNTYTPLGQYRNGPIGGGILVAHGVELAESVFGIRLSPTDPTHMKGRIVAENANNPNGTIRTYLDVSTL